MKDKTSHGKNKYGLSRHIPPSIRMEIRKKSGFGCIICGFAICQYEHVDPEFNEATKHDPDCMTLLCGRCNDKKRRGILSKEAVKRAMLNPRCLQEGFTFDSFDIGTHLPIVQFGNTTWEASQTFVLLRINGDDLVRFDVPEEAGGPYLLSAQFFGSNGKRIFWIERNEWGGSVDNWDIEAEGRVITIKSTSRNYELQITNVPNERLIINKVHMVYKGYEIVADEIGGMMLTTPRARVYMDGGESTGTGIEVVAFDVVRDNVHIGVARGPSSKIVSKIGYIRNEHLSQHPERHK